jgi:hypothetical protein
MTEDTQIIGDNPRALLEARAVKGPEISPLSEQHFAQVRRVIAVRRPVVRTARTARASAWTILIIGLLSLPLAVLSMNVLSIGVVVGVCIIGLRERAGAARLLRGDVDAAGMLAGNQLAFLLLILLYCGVQIGRLAAGGGAAGAISSVEAQLSQALDPATMAQLKRMTNLATYGLYGLVAGISILYQGGMAAYYYSRRQHLLTLRQTTPPWIERLLRELND